jgi:hypothetical protein
MEEKVSEKVEFLDNIDKISNLLKEEMEDLEEDDIKYARTKLKEVDNICKQKYKKTNTEIIKNFLSTLRNKIPEKEKIIETLKKIKKVRIIIKED